MNKQHLLFLYVKSRQPLHPSGPGRRNPGNRGRPSLPRKGFRNTESN